MTEQPWLTIVTVVKDDEHGLDRTIHSLREEDLDGVEFLVIDSSADPNAAPRVLHAHDISGHVVWTEPHGIYGAMNVGLEQASGRYIYFLNAGDELSAGALTRLRTLLLSEGPTWLYSDVEITSLDGSTATTQGWDFETEREYAFTRGAFAPHQGTVVKTEVMRSLGGFESGYRIAADYAMFLRLTEIEAPTYLSGTFARFHEGGASTQAWLRGELEFHRARTSILDSHTAAGLRPRFAALRRLVAQAAHRSPWPLVAAFVLGALIMMGLTGVEWGTAALLTAFALLQGVGGAIWWRLMQPRRAVPIIEAIGMGLGLGTALAMLTGLIWQWWAGPAALILILIVLRIRQHSPLRQLAPVQRTDLLALLIGGIPGLGALLIAFRSYPLSWNGLWTRYHGDMPFFEALSTSVAKFGAGSSIFLDGADLRYHSLAYGWAGQLSIAANAEPFVVLTRLLPILVLIALVTIASAWTRQLTQAQWAPALAAALITMGGFVGATFGGVLNFDSPSQSLSTVWLLALSVLVLRALTNGPRLWQAMAIAIMIVAVTGGKISTAAIATAAIAFLALCGLFIRAEWRKRAVLFAGISILAAIAAYIWLIAGSANAGGLSLFTLLDRASSVQGLNPVVTQRGIAAGVFVLILAVIPRWAGLVWLIGDRETRRQPDTLYGLGLALAGIASLILLSGGFNDLWFSVAASAPLAVLSAVGIAHAIAWLGPNQKRRIVIAGLLAIAAAAFVAWLWATGSTGVIGDGWRWAGPPVAFILAIAIGVLLAHRRGPRMGRQIIAFALIALVVMSLPARPLYAVAEPLARPYQGSWSPVLFSTQTDFVPIIDQDLSPGLSDLQMAAGLWLREAADPTDVIATNMTRSALVPALSRLQTFASDLPLQTPYGRPDDVDLALSRERASWTVIDSPSMASLQPLCRGGVTWIWVDPTKTTTEDWQPYAVVAYANDDVVILRIAQSACG